MREVLHQSLSSCSCGFGQFSHLPCFSPNPNLPLPSLPLPLLSLTSFLPFPYFDSPPYPSPSSSLSSSRLQEQSMPAGKSVAPSPPPRTAEEKGMDANVARWIEERDCLLQTGVYSSSDPTIQRLDHKIRENLYNKSQ